MTSILETIKKMLGIEADYTHFDPELIVLINGVFSALFQLGVGPQDKQFSITGATETWDNFLTDSEAKDEIENVKTYIYLKVRLIFDPPTIGGVLDAYKAEIERLEWRLNVACDPTAAEKTTMNLKPLWPTE